MRNRLYFFLACICICYESCIDSSSNIIKDIHIGLHNNNQLRIQFDVTTIKDAEIYAEYWPDSAKNEKEISLTSKKGLQHSLVLTNILADTKYDFQLYTIHDDKKLQSKIYNFQSEKLAPWLQEQFKVNCPMPQLLPANFASGFLVLNKRETPGLTYIVDTKGRLRWYNMVDGTGIKVTHFTKDKTIISILGTNDEPTSYGSAILEVNLIGDTLLYLKKGMNDLKYTIHHEVFKNDKNQIVTLFVDKRVMDLSSVGGNAKDTVTGDGIIVLDNKGKKVWQWSVIDAFNPLKDPNILKDKKDWMHANSLCFDKDGNYLISFYNNGQIWKVNATTGEIMWKFGKGGTFKMPPGCNFSMAHAAHINANGDLMFFNNGIDKHQSEVYAIKLNEVNQTAKTDMHIKLPQEIYNDRMGSAYLINDTTVLCCCSKRHITVLTNKKAVLLWSLDTAIPPYRVEFVNKEELKDWFLP
ncbi:MAG: aryl-sulfate sulfotransferase [Chitinophagaceae bacterium]